MIANLVGHWLLGLPVGAALCFWRGQGVLGLWAGLSIGLIAVALALTHVWSRRMRMLGAELGPRNVSTGADRRR
jgi:MATE family multidrug resistance protein